MLGFARKLATALLWMGAGVSLAGALWLVLRSCSYDVGTVAAYAVYFGLQVVLPGVVLVALIRGKPLTWTQAIALAVPTGFGVEVLSFLGLSALGMRSWVAALPFLWGALGVLWWRSRGIAPLSWRVTRKHAGIAATLSFVFLCTVVAATSQMFAESPLVSGLPQRPIFHDWVYLVSRAAAIKQHWPIEDPSLAGTPLHYHYFMLVHVAAASWSSGTELTLLMLRLTIVPLGGVLVVQAYVLGRMLSRRVWGGLAAAGLVICASGMTFQSNYNRTDFLDLFMRWVYVSPTFFFGIIFFGALMILVAEASEARRVRWRMLAWMALLSASGAGAKGTVVPVLLAGMGLWALWRWYKEKRLPWRLVGIATALAVPFTFVYVNAMSQWGTGDAEITPFRIYQITAFWHDYGVEWQRFLIGILPHYELAIWLGAAACALAVIAGTSGVRLLAIPYLVQGAKGHRTPLAHLLGATFLAAVLMGTFVHLDSNGELYVILLMRLPLAVLTGAFAVSAWERLGEWRREVWGEMRGVAGATRSRSVGWLRAAGVGVAGAGVALTLMLQVTAWTKRSHHGFAQWMQTKPVLAVSDDLLPLYETMRWVRANTEKDAVLMANAFTTRTMTKGRGISVDHTTVGVHYYYSALSERRMWIEGPSYQLDTAETIQRLTEASRVFYHGKVPTTAMFASRPSYVMIDHRVGDGAKVPLTAKDRVFANGRYEIYRVPEGKAAKGYAMVAD